MLRIAGALVCLILVVSGTVLAESWGETLTVTDFNDLSNWSPFKDNRAVAGGMDLVEPGIAKMWYKDTPTQRDLWTWDFSPGSAGLDISGYATMVFLAKFTPGAFLTVETKIDGRFTRLISYLRVLENGWVEVAAPIPSGRSLELLRIGISEPGSPIDLGGKEIYMLLDWIKLSKTTVEGIRVTPIPDTITLRM